MMLWAVLVGGTVEGMRLEVHDILFASGETIEDCYPALRAQWRGVPASLHLDAWGRLDGADGHALGVSDTPPVGRRLWFVHTGGYDAERFAEHHDNHFVVAATRDEAKRRAVSRHGAWTLPHKDALMAVDTVIDLTGAAGPGAAGSGSEGKGRFLVPTPREGATFSFTADYVPIGR